MQMHIFHCLSIHEKQSLEDSYEFLNGQRHKLSLKSTIKNSADRICI